MDLEKIQKRIEQVEAAQNEQRLLKVTLDDALKEDSSFQELDLQLRELNTKKKKIKDEIWGQQTYQEALAKMKDVKEEIKDLSDILNHELLEWRKENDSDEIIGLDGTLRKLKINVRLQPQHGRGAE
jgi:hypothetical protein